MFEGIPFLKDIDLKKNENFYFKIKVNSRDVKIKENVIKFKITDEEREIINTIQQISSENNELSFCFDPDKVKYTLENSEFIIFIFFSDILVYTINDGPLRRILAKEVYPNVGDLLKKAFDEIKELKEENKKLIEDVKFLKTQIEYAPEGSGYKETKEHFETLSTSFS